MAGERSAQAEIARMVRAFAKHVCRGGGPVGAPEADWEDVAQECLGRLFAGGLDRYRGTGSEASYLYTAVKCTVIDLSRKARRRQSRESSAAPVERADSRDPDAGIEVEWILSRVSEECRELIERAVIRGQPYDTLARDLGMAESSVRAKLSRCIRRARETTSRMTAP